MPSQTSTAINTKQEELVVAAFHEIAQKGFAGLRTREVAAQVGITQATLHYYFPSKHKLIQAVVSYAVERIDIVRSARTTDSVNAADQRLQLYFTTIFEQMQREPEVFLVLDEIALYAQREEGIAHAMGESDRAWKRYLVDLLQLGKEQGLFRPDLNTGATAEIIVAFCKGAVLQIKSDPAITQGAIAQLHRWITS